MQVSALRSLIFSFSLLALPLAAAAPLAPVGSQEAHERSPSVWTGRVIDKSGTKQEEPLTETYARDLRQKLAAVRVTLDVDHKLEEASAASLELWIRATRAGYPERKELLVEALLLRSRILRALTRGPTAVTELNDVFPSAPPDSLFEFVPLTMADRHVMTEVARDPRIMKAREELAGPRASLRVQSSEDRIDAIVGDALERGDLSLSTSLGERAVPALVAIIETSLEDFPTLTRDPFYHLAAINTARAADLIAGAYSRGGSIWKARVLRLMNQGVFLDGAGGSIHGKLWKPGSGDNPPSFAVPRWFDVLEILLLDPAMKREAVQLLRGLPERNALTPGIQRALVAILMDPSSQQATEVLNALSNGRGRPAVKTVLEAVLSSPAPEVRAFAAEMLEKYERSDELVASVRNSDTTVRMAIARILRTHQETVPQGTGGWREQWVTPKLEPSDRAALEILAADADASVRAEAAATIAQLSSPLDASVYAKLARDPDSRVRAAVLTSKSLPLEQRATLALELAGDADDGVLRSFDNAIRDVAKASGSEIVPEAWLPALRARRTNAALPFECNDGPSTTIYDRLAKTNAGMRLLAEWISGPDDVLPARSFTRRLGIEPEPWPLDIDAALMAKVYRGLSSLKDNQSANTLVRYLTVRDRVPAAEFLAVAEDAVLDSKVRLGALAVAAKGKHSRIGPLLITLLSADDVGRFSEMGLGGEHTQMVASELEDAQSKSAAEELLTNPKVNARLAFDALNAIAGRRTLTSAEADKVLARWLDDPARNSSFVVTNSLQEVGLRPRPRQGDWLVRAAHIAQTCTLAFRLIGDTRDDSYVDLLRQAIVGPFAMTGDAQPNYYRPPALNALTRYFDARAADIILEALGSTPDAAFRDECFKALETIRRYEAEKGRVAKDRATQAATATAVRDLVAMLSDPSAPIRAQALRALATLGAVEEMPAIVRRLKDSDEAVRKAAEAALDTLNAPPANK